MLLEYIPLKTDSVICDGNNLFKIVKYETAKRGMP